MNLVGYLSKMESVLQSPVNYSLPLNDQSIPLNPLLGKTLTMHFKGNIRCISCQRSIKKTYQEGYCFPCTQKLARCDLCIVRPERCHYEASTCREPDWGLRHCMTSHIVYLANASSLKVGLTRHSQIPTRWVDQGASQALPIAKVVTRKIAGQIESHLAKSISDKTNWRKMLSEVESINLISKSNEVIDLIAEGIHAGKYLAEGIQFLTEMQMINICYPVLTYPTKIKSISFEQYPVIEGTLLGIKGQYLIFDIGVINIRKHTGYEIKLVF